MTDSLYLRICPYHNHICIYDPLAIILLWLLALNFFKAVYFLKEAVVSDFFVSYLQLFPPLATVSSTAANSFKSWRKENLQEALTNGCLLFILVLGEHCSIIYVNRGLRLKLPEFRAHPLPTVSCRILVNSLNLAKPLLLASEGGSAHLIRLL